METVLILLKSDLGIKATGRDEYFTSLLNASKKEIERKGIKLDLDVIDDQVLLADYAAWYYRHRHEDVPLSRNLRLRIRNRIMKVRAGLDEGDNHDSE